MATLLLTLLVATLLLPLTVVLEVGLILVVEVLLVATVVELLGIDADFLKQLTALCGVDLSALTQQPLQHLAGLLVVAPYLPDQAFQRGVDVQPERVARATASAPMEAG